MKWFRNLPIRRKVNAVTLLIFGFAALFSMAGVLIYHSIAYPRKATADLSAFAELVAASINSSVVFNDPDEAAHVMGRLHSRSDIVEAHVLKLPTQELFVSSPTNAVLPGWIRVRGEGAYFEREGLWIVKNLTDERFGSQFAQLAIFSDLRTLRQERSQSLFVQSGVLIALLALASLAARSLRRSLTEPLSALAATVHEISVKQDHRLRAPKLSEDEVGSLANDFNNMLASLEKQSAVLRESEERYRLLTENSTNYVSEVDAQLRIQYISPNCRELGYESSELVGRNLVDFIHAEDWPAIAPKLQQSATSSIYRFRLKDGAWRWLESSSQSFITSNGDERRVVVSRDITDRMQAEEEKAKLEAQLRQAQKMEAIGTLAGGIAHDFNNILASIIPYTQLAIEDLKGNSEASECLREVLKATDRAKGLVQQILAFSRKQPPQHALVRLQPLLKEGLKLIRSALPSSLEIVTHIDDAVPAVTADPSQIHQVLMNLCTNAAHAMKDRPGRLEVALGTFAVDEDFSLQFPDLRPGQHVKLTVTDNGRGIENELLKRIFDPFFTTKSPGEGTGLGLSVVHGIVKAHQGAVQVYSRVGEGSSFNIYLPASNAAPDLVAEHVHSAPPRGRGQHILFVDDETPICLTAQRILNRLGYHATVFSEPEKALEHFKSQPDHFDLVMTDLTMPRMTGLFLAGEISRLRPGLPILLTSGYIGLTSSEEMKRANIREVIAKPLAAATYAEALSRHLTNAPAQNSARAIQ